MLIHKIKFFLPFLFLCLVVQFFEISQGVAANSNLIGIQNIRISLGYSVMRVVVDSESFIDFEEYYFEDPSRLVVDFKNAKLNSNIKTELELESTVAKKINVIQLNSSTVRLTIETMSAINFLGLDDGLAGYRTVIDVGDEKYDPDFVLKNIELLNSSQSSSDGLKSEEIKRQIKQLRSELKQQLKMEREERRLLKEKEKQERKKLKELQKNERISSKDYYDDIMKELNNLTSLKGRKIIIDPGHGGSDPGAIGYNGVIEKDIVLKVSLALKELLQKEGAEVLMTREIDKEVSWLGAQASAVDELQARCEVANKLGAEIFVSIHANSFVNSEVSGIEVYYAEGSYLGQKLAECIKRNLVTQLNSIDRGIKAQDLYVILHTNMPAVLIELGFITNKHDAEILNSKTGIRKSAEGILDGIEDYFGEN